MTTDEIQSLHDAINQVNKRLDKFEPLLELYKNVNSFRQVSLWFLKAFALLGAGLAGLYILVKEFKLFLGIH